MTTKIDRLMAKKVEQARKLRVFMCEERTQQTPAGVQPCTGCTIVCPYCDED